MLTIWGRENSNNVRKVLWCAAELGLSYTHINAGGALLLRFAPLVARVPEALLLLSLVGTITAVIGATPVVSTSPSCSIQPMI